MEHNTPNRPRRSRASVAACVALVMSMVAGACASDDAATSGNNTDVSVGGVDSPATDSEAAPPAGDTTPPPVETASPSSDGPSPTDDTAAPDTAPQPGSAVGTDAELPADVAAAMSSAGIAVVDSPEPVETDAIFTLTTSQAQFMAEEATSGSGVVGYDLDAAGGGATQGLPMVAVLAGYVRGVDTPGAEYSRTLLAGQDLTHPEGVVFPMIVLALFASDAASAFAADEVAGVTSSAGPPTSAGFAGGFGSSRHYRAAGICSDVTKTIFNAIEKIFAKIHIPEAKVGDTGSKFLNGVLQGLTDVVIGGLNFVIDVAKKLIIEGVEFILGKVLSIVAEVAAAAALVANIVSAVRPWKLDVTAKDPNTKKGVDPDKVYDEATAKAIIIGPTDDWPGWFTDCAKVAGVTLPSLLPVDAPVTWKVFSYVPSADLMSESTDQIKKDDKLRKEGKEVLAKLGLVTGMETKEKADKGAEQHGPVLVTATARRNQIEELRKTLVTAATNLAGNILSNVPSIIKNFLLDLVKQAAEGSSQEIAGLLDASGKVLIDVLYHGDPEPEKPPVPPATAAAWSFAFFSNGSVAPSIAGYTCGGLVSTWHVIFGAGAPELERTYDLAFSSSTMTVHHDLIYDVPPAGTSSAVHIEWRWDYFLDTAVSPPMIRITGTQYESSEGREFVFESNFGTGDGIVVENKSLPKLLEGRNLSHPFLSQAAAECG